MFERFTDRARRAIVHAQEEARLLGHTYIGTEHLLLGLMREGEGVGAQALIQHGVSLEAARNQVREIIGEGTESPASHIPFTPRAKKVFEHSLREAIGLGHNYMGTEHILLGLIREGEGVAVQVLTSLGVTLGPVRQTILSLLDVTEGQQPSGSRRPRRPFPRPTVPTHCRHEPAHLRYRKAQIAGEDDLPAIGVTLIRCANCLSTIGVLPT